MNGPSSTPEIRRKLKEIQEAVIRAVPDVGQIYPPRGEKRCPVCNGKGIFVSIDPAHEGISAECSECAGYGRVLNTENTLMVTRPIRISDILITVADDRLPKGWDIKVRAGDGLLISGTMAADIMTPGPPAAWNLLLDDLALQDAILVSFIHSIIYPPHD